MSVDVSAADPIADDVLSRKIADVRSADEEVTRAELAGVEGFDRDPWKHANCGYPISHEQGNLLYVLARMVGARRVVEFATSIGLSTMYLAAAVRDNGGGLVIGSELVPAKAERARRNLDDAGLGQFVDIRVGDGLHTLRDIGEPADMLLLDGWPDGENPSLDRQMLDVLVPQLRPGAVLIDDNHQRDVVEFLRDPANGFRTANLTLRRGSTEIALKSSPLRMNR